MDIFIYGTGGHAKVIFDIASSIKTYNIVCFVDDKSEENDFFGLPVLKTAEAIKLTKMGTIAIGANHIREKVSNEIKSINSNVNFISLVHPSSIISEDVEIGSGTVVMPGAIINAHSKVGQQCVINTGAIVEHDCSLADFSSVAPGVVIGGKVSLGLRSFVGLGAKVKHGADIGDDTVIGMGAIVTENISANKLAYGTPCKVVSDRKKDESYL